MNLMFILMALALACLCLGVRRNSVARRFLGHVFVGILFYALAPWAKLRRFMLYGRENCFANIAEGQHGSGNVTFLADTSLVSAVRFLPVKTGSDSAHVAVTTANTEIPKGICTDSANAIGDPVNVAVFGEAKGTLKGVLVGTVAVDDELCVAATGLTKIPTTTWTGYVVGRAMQAGVSGDVVEFAHCFPMLRVVA